MSTSMPRGPGRAGRAAVAVLAQQRLDSGGVDSPTPDRPLSTLETVG
ncbi:hypothetical protein [Dactylosporangium matsuzakiense]